MQNSGNRLSSTRGQIAIVGAGSVAQALGHLLFVAGQPVVALAGRDRRHADQAAAFIHPSVRVVTYAELPGLASRVLIAVSDDAIPEVGAALAAAGMRTGTALHTCGSAGPEALDALTRAGVSCGVLHPLQTVASPEQGVKSLDGIAVGLAGDGPALAWAEEIVGVLKGYAVRIAPEGMPLYHASAVLASNAVVGLIDAAAALLSHVGLDREEALRAISPLCRTSLDNALRRGPVAALTGPVSRGDAHTIARHAGAMREAEPAIARLYLAVNRYLLDVARRGGLPEQRLRAVEVALDTAELGDDHGRHRHSGS